MQAISKFPSPFLHLVRRIADSASSPVWIRRWLAAGVAVAGILAMRPLLTSAAPADGRKIELLVMGNDGEIHAFEKTTAYVVPELVKEGINCFYSTSVADLN